MILNYIKGYYILNLSGGMPEKLLNRCAANGIEILRLEHVKNGYNATIYRRNYKEFADIAEKYGCKIKTEKYVYILRDLGKFRRRYIFIAGMIFFSVFLIICSQYIWDITVDGNYTFTYEDIVSCVNESGVCNGTAKSRISCDDIEKYIRNKYFDITWVSAEIKGTRLIIHIKENFDDYVIEDEEGPYDIVAEKDAEIVSIITRSGTPLVKAGDTVQPGDTLIASAVEVLDNVGEFARYEYVNSDGDIYARTNYTYADELSLNYTVKIYTGKYQNSYMLRFFDMEFKTNMFAYLSDECDKFESVNQIILFRNFYLPVYYGKIQYRFFETSDYMYTEDEIKLIAADNFEYYIDTLKESGVAVENSSLECVIRGDVCYATGVLTAVEKIGSLRDAEIIEEENKTEDEYY